MPLLASWRDFLPPDEKASRYGLDEALAAARKRSSALARLDVARASAGLYDAVAEAMRAEVLFDPQKSRGFAGEFGGVARNVAAAPEAIVALAALAAVQGKPIDGSRLVQHAGVPPLPLAYAALAAGNADLARTLTDDPRVQALAYALETGVAAPFLDAVEQFPSAEGVGYAELACLSRAFVTYVEGRPVERAADWVRWVVSEGRERPRPERVASVAPAAPSLPALVDPTPTPEQATRGAQLFGAGPAGGAWTGWSNVVLEDVEGLHGGRTVAISCSGEVWAIEVSRGCHVAWRLHAWLRDLALTELMQLLTTNDPRALPPSARNGIPGESLVALTFVVDGKATTVRRWSGDRNASFDAVKQFLHEVGTILMATVRPVAIGRWDGRFETG